MILHDKRLLRDRLRRAGGTLLPGHPRRQGGGRGSLTPCPRPITSPARGSPSSWVTGIWVQHFRTLRSRDRLRHLPAHSNRRRGRPQRPPGRRGGTAPCIPGAAGRPVRRTAQNRLGCARQRGAACSSGRPCRRATPIPPPSAWSFWTKPAFCAPRAQPLASWARDTSASPWSSPGGDGGDCGSRQSGRYIEVNAAPKAPLGGELAGQRPD